MILDSVKGINTFNNIFMRPTIYVFAKYIKNTDYLNSYWFICKDGSEFNFNRNASMSYNDVKTFEFHVDFYDCLIIDFFNKDKKLYYNVTKKLKY